MLIIAQVIKRRVNFYALVASLAPGNYTAIVRGKNNTTGVGLVEVYELQ
jgi:hypothetical protein